MSDLPMDEKLKIANSGGYFAETGQSSWVGTRIRKRINKRVGCRSCGTWGLRKNFVEVDQNQVKCPKCSSTIFVGNEEHKYGCVVRDLNGAYRRLKVRFEDGTEDEIQMNNIGEDPEYVHEFEWFCKHPNHNKWLRF